MRFGSVCSGIEAASVAWEPLGWRASFLSEIDDAPRAVLSARFPAAPLHGDFTTIDRGEYDPIDLLVGGTPCQSFSLAGLRGGLGDGRGGLALEFFRLAQRLRPRWLLWENVPGVLSSGGGRDFGSILGAMVECGYGFAYRVLDAQYVRVDGYERAVPQRRQRVFALGYFGDWRPAAAVLFERESVFGHPPPGRDAGQTDGSDAAGSVGERCNAGDVSFALSAKGGAGRFDLESQTLLAEPCAPTIPSRSTAGGGLGTDFDLDGGLVAFTCKGDGGDVSPVSPPLRAMSHAASQMNGGGQVAVAFAIQERAVSDNPLAGPDGAGFSASGAAYSLEARQTAQAVAFSLRGHAGGAAAEMEPDGVAPALRGADGGSSRPFVCFDETQVTSLGNWSLPRADVCHPLSAGARPLAVASQWCVRRLMPVECERLQGFPDGWTAVPWRGGTMPDSRRYKMLGNSMAVNVMRWIGRRIELVEGLR